MSRVTVLPSLAIPVTQVRTTSQRTGKQSHPPSIKMGSDDSHFNVSLIVRDKVTKTVFTDHNLFEERGKTKQNLTNVLLLTSLSLYC